MTQHNMVYISLVDSMTTDYEIFENLYKPKYSDVEFPHKFQITNTTSSTRIYGRPNPTFINPTHSLIYETESFYNHSNEIRLQNYKLLISKEVRKLQPLSWDLDSLISNLFHIFNYDKFFDINLEVHKDLIEKYNYTPIAVDKSFLKAKYPNWLQEGSSRYLQEVAEPFFEWLDNIKIMYWKKPMHTFVPNEGPLKDKTIHSMYSELIFNSLSQDILNVDNTQNVIKLNPTELDLSRQLSDRSQNRKYWRHNQSATSNYDTESKSVCLNTFMYSDLSFAKEENYNTEEKFCPYIVNNIFPKNKIKVIKVPSWKSQTNQKKIEFTSYTTKQFLSRQISFAGIIYFYDSINASLEEQEILYFALISNACHHDLAIRSRTCERLETLINHLFWNEGIKLSNPQKAKEILEKLYKGINKYSDFFLDKLEESQLESIAQIENKKNNCFDDQKNSSLTLKPKINPILEKKYKKLHFNINKHIENIEYDYTQYLKFKLAAEDIRSCQAALQLANKNITNHIQANYDLIKNIYNSANYIKRNKSIYNSISVKYNNEYESCLQEMNFKSDNFFENLSNNNIKIIKLIYTEDSDEQNELMLCQDSSFEDLKTHTKASNYSNNYKIQRVKFLIDHPVKIKIDSNPDNVRVGGPYLVEVTNSSLKIKLAYNYSLCGYKEGSFAVHPHTASKRTFNACLNDWSNACLGEAASLIYKAFEKNDLKLIIISCLTWVFSANSSDVWGRKYNWFIKENELKTDSPIQHPPQEEKLREEDVNTFLDDMFEGSLENQDLETNQNQNQESWSPENFTTVQDNYTPFTQNNN